MSAVEVARLRLRCDARQEGQARFAVEDALRTEIPDDGRLVLLRRMRIAPAGSSAHPAKRQAAVREAWTAATGGARHGSDDGAAEANCVWFASQSEAEAVLLARLLRGWAAEGWFWKMALPGWRAQPLAEWLADSLADCLSASDDRRLLTLVETCVEAGAAEKLVAALVQAGQANPERLRPRGSHLAAAETQSAPFKAAAPARVAEMAATIPLPAPLREVACRLLGSLNAPAAARAILRAHAMRESPALALSPMLLEDVVAVLVSATAEDNAASSRVHRDPLHRPPPPVQRVMAEAEVAVPREARPPYTSPPAEARTATLTAQEPLPSDSAPPGEARVPRSIARPLVPLRSAHAGLWLAVPSLCDMGLRPWLAARPDLLADHPGRQLVAAMARHYRIADDDPALAVLGEVDPRRPLPDWTAIWRHGLDRWLRRQTRRRLHDLVHRPGRLHSDDQRLSIIYPPGDADIRLRRRALDRDPGWTDWLGLSIRFHFHDEVLA